MTKQTIMLNMYEHTEDWRKGQNTVDVYDYRRTPECMVGRVWIGEQEVEIDFPEIDTRQFQIDELERQIIAERCKSEASVNLLLDRISKLQAIGHDD
jgi:hypothetical protein